MNKKILFLLLFSFFSARAGIPMFTADYYLANPRQWLGKTITLSIASVDVPRSERNRADGLRQLSAYTYSHGESGGYIEILATQTAASRLLNLCGGNLKYNAGEVATILIQGKFEQESSGNRYFLFVDR
jgi:uncharacterized protein YPO0396